MRVGVVGCGYWGSKHLRVLSALPEVTAVAAIDPDTSRQQAMLERFADQAFPDLTSALAAVDAVVVAVPPALHFRVASEAIAAGKHVLVEKPLATSAHQARTLVQHASDTGVVLMVGHTFEYAAALNELRSLIVAGELGDLQYVDAAWLNLGLYQEDINVVWDLAPHGVSVANFLLGSRPTTLAAWASSHGTERSHEDVALLRLEYEEPDATAYIRVSWLDPVKVRRVTVVGTERMAVFNDLARFEPLRIYDRGVDREADSYAASGLAYRYGSTVSPYIAATEPLTTELSHFLECIQTGAPPRTDGASGVAVVTALEAADRALAGGHFVDVAPPISLVSAFGDVSGAEFLQGNAAG